MKPPSQKWDLRYLELARHVGSWSKDPSTKVGAVVVDSKNRLVSVGYNGLPQGVEDSPGRLDNRELKYKMIVHAERNALLFAGRDLSGCMLYTHPFMPCAACASMVIQSGVVRVVSYRVESARWSADFALTMDLFREADVGLVLYDQTVQSIANNI